MSTRELRRTFKGFNRFMLLLWRLGLGAYGNGTRYGGSIMVLKTTGRKSGLTRHTPVNYAIHAGDVYCTAGFGAGADWYKNLLANPQVEIWLPDSRWAGIAVDATDAENRSEVLRQVLVASGFAAPLFGINPDRLTDLDLDQLCETYRLVRIARSGPLTGVGGPGDLAWVWPTSTFVLLSLLAIVLRKRKRS